MPLAISCARQPAKEARARPQAKFVPSPASRMDNSRAIGKFGSVSFKPDHVVPPSADRPHAQICRHHDFVRVSGRDCRIGVG